MKCLKNIVQQFLNLNLKLNLSVPKLVSVHLLGVVGRTKYADLGWNACFTAYCVVLVKWTIKIGNTKNVYSKDKMYFYDFIL